MKEIDKMDADDITSDATLKEVFAVDDVVERSRLIMRLSMRASNLRVKGQFERIIKAYEQADRERRKREMVEHPPSSVEHWTNFTGPYDRQKCGAWIADDSGIRMYDERDGTQGIVACGHPIMPVTRMRNIQTGEEQITLAFRRSKEGWSEVTVPKTTIAKRSSIIGLAARSILVNDDNALALMRYLADVERENEEEIPLVRSTSKLGWVGGVFMPYSDKFAFDGDLRFMDAYNAIGTYGSREAFYAHLRELRGLKRFEIDFMLAAALASPLMPIIESLPFVVDFYGETGGGKTVLLMLGTSCYANPGKGMYIGDYQSTDVGFEVKENFLNNLPMVCDDTSKRSAYMEKHFEDIIYTATSGKGKTRSNRELGINRESTWCNVMITNGEKPITSYVSQGGAINRVLEIEVQTNIFPNPQRTVAIISDNYGWLGFDFICKVMEIGNSEVEKIFHSFLAEVMKDKKAQKQSMSLAAVLTADKIAVDYLYGDGRYMDIEQAKKILLSQEELSDNQRCYRYLVDKVYMNKARFNDDTNIERWGWITGDCAVFYSQAMEQLCRDGGYSKRSFLSWAGRNGLIDADIASGKNSQVKRINGKSKRCIFLRLPNEEEQNTRKGEDPGDEWINPGDYGQMDLPFEE